MENRKRKGKKEAHLVMLWPMLCYVNGGKRERERLNLNITRKKGNKKIKNSSANPNVRSK